MIRLAALAAVLALAACSGTVSSVSPPSASPAGTPTAPGSQHCGTERWPVKTGTDPDAAQVNLAPVVPATIAQLTAGAAPPLPLPQAARVKPAEVTVYQVTAALTQYRIEADGDVHAVLSDAGKTMIAEFPDPACATGSRFLPQITAARNAFDTRFHPSDVWQQAGAQVTVTGIGFYDPEHGQTGGGVLAGGQVTIELHPALSITVAS